MSLNNGRFTGRNAYLRASQMQLANIYRNKKYLQHKLYRKMNHRFDVQ